MILCCYVGSQKDGQPAPLHKLCHRRPKALCAAVSVMGSLVGLYGVSWLGVDDNVGISFFFQLLFNCFFKCC